MQAAVEEDEPVVAAEPQVPAAEQQPRAGDDDHDPEREPGPSGLHLHRGRRPRHDAADATSRSGARNGQTVWLLRRRRTRSAVGGCELNRLANSHLAAGERVDDVRRARARGRCPSAPASRTPRSSRARGRAARRRAEQVRRRCGRPRTRGCGRAPSAASPPRSGRGSPWRARRTTLPPSRSSPPPPKIAPHIAMRATNVMPERDRRRDRADEDVAVARRARSRGRARRAARLGRATWRMPCVTATAAWCGLRPVAKALGCVGGADVERGHRHARRAGVRSRTMA